MQRLRDGLVFKAHRLSYRSTLGLRRSTLGLRGIKRPKLWDPLPPSAHTPRIHLFNRNPDSLLHARLLTSVPNPIFNFDDFGIQALQIERKFAPHMVKGAQK